MLVTGTTPSMRRPVSVKAFLSFFCFFLSFSLFLLFPNCFPLSQAASVATLPSALFVERWSLGASWVYSIQSVLLPDYRPLLPPLRWELGQELVAVTGSRPAPLHLYRKSPVGHRAPETQNVNDKGEVLCIGDLASGELQLDDFCCSVDFKFPLSWAF